MMCYRDMTFCSGDGCAKFDACPRALTDKVKAAAEKASLLIARFEDPKTLKCYQTPECDRCFGNRIIDRPAMPDMMLPRYANCPKCNCDGKGGVA